MGPERADAAIPLLMEPTEAGVDGTPIHNQIDKGRGTSMASSKRTITIVGGGQAGLQLGCGLLDNGYEVHLTQNRGGEETPRG